MISKVGVYSFFSLRNLEFENRDLIFSFCREIQQPRPLKCASCEAIGRTECVWCQGTGFFILGNSMLCEVPSRNTTCVICSGQVNSLFSQFLVDFFSMDALSSARG